MSAHCAYVGEQAVERHHRCKPWKDGQQSKKRHTSGGGEHPILGNRPDHAPEDVRPTTARNVLRALGFAASAWLGSPLVGCSKRDVVSRACLDRAPVLPWRFLISHEGPRSSAHDAVQVKLQPFGTERNV